MSAELVERFTLQFGRDRDAADRKSLTRGRAIYQALKDQPASAYSWPSQISKGRRGQARIVHEVAKAGMGLQPTAAIAS
jgi:F0F1-type ATP synthase alpha subunit